MTKVLLERLPIMLREICITIYCVLDTQEIPKDRE